MYAVLRTALDHARCVQRVAVYAMASLLGADEPRLCMICRCRSDHLLSAIYSCIAHLAVVPYVARVAVADGAFAHCTAKFPEAPSGSRLEHNALAMLAHTLSAIPTDGRADILAKCNVRDLAFGYLRGVLPVRRECAVSFKSCRDQARVGAWCHVTEPS
jgi:hypothetical protein